MYKPLLFVYICIKSKKKAYLINVYQLCTIVLLDGFSIESEHISPSRNNFTERVPYPDPAADYGTIAYYSLKLLFVAIIIIVGLIVMILLEPIPLG